jgi:uncharacterized protein (TIGR01244 family)
MQPTKINDLLSVAGQIDKDDIAQIAAAGFATIVNNRPDDEEPGQLGHVEAEAEAAKRGLRYSYLPVTSGSITRTQVADFQKLLLRGPGPVLAHCRSGTRCYLLWALSRVLFERESAMTLVAEAALKGYDLRVLPSLAERLEAER